MPTGGVSHLLEVSTYDGPGYRALVDYGDWRVAILRYIDELRVDRLAAMQRHDDTDEVFVLLAGRCILFLGEGQDSVRAIHAQDMEPLRLYNVKKGAWHTHTLSQDATVLVIENRNTSHHNSPVLPLRADLRLELAEHTRALWGAGDRM